VKERKKGGKERKKERKKEKRMFGKETRANLLDLSVVQSGFILNDSSVSVVNRLLDEERGIGVQFPARRSFILFHKAQIGSVSTQPPI
jgi:ribosomal protein S8E